MIVLASPSMSFKTDVQHGATCCEAHLLQGGFIMNFQLEEAKLKYPDPDEVVKTLSMAFARASYRGFKTNIAKVGDPLYPFQVEFAYKLDEIRQGPLVGMQGAIREAREIIARVGKAATQA